MLRTMLRSARAAYAGARRYFGYLLFDRPAGIETTRVVRLSDIGLAGDRRVDYEPSPWLALRRVLPKREVGTQDVFIDFGCGKGRVVLQAAMYPFRKVIGVELSPQLCKIARDNIERSRAKFVCRDVEVVCKDVLDYDIPDELTVAYFYNPFEGPLFEAVVEKLVDSLRRKPRALRIVYMNPVEESTLLLAGAQRVRATHGMRPTRAWARENSVRLYTLALPESGVVPGGKPA
jgi:SAM-dependent methyltransferase